MKVHKEVIQVRTVEYTLRLTHEELEQLEYIAVFLENDSNYRDFAGKLFRVLHDTKECRV